MQEPKKILTFKATHKALAGHYFKYARSIVICLVSLILIYGLFQLMVGTIKVADKSRPEVRKELRHKSMGWEWVYFRPISLKNGGKVIWENDSSSTILYYPHTKKAETVKELWEFGVEESHNPLYAIGSILLAVAAVVFICVICSDVEGVLNVYRNLVRTTVIINKDEMLIQKIAYGWFGKSYDYEAYFDEIPKIVIDKSNAWFDDFNDTGSLILTVRKYGRGSFSENKWSVDYINDPQGEKAMIWEGLERETGHGVDILSLPNSQEE